MNLNKLYKARIFDTEADLSNLESFAEVERTILVEKEIPAIERAKNEINQKLGIQKCVPTYKQQFDKPSNVFGHKLVVQYIITLKKSHPVNQISITAHNFGENCYVKINKLRVYDGQLVDVPTFRKGQIIVQKNSTRMSDNQYSRTVRWIFPSKNVSQIMIELEQSNPYPVRYSMACYVPYMDLGDKLEMSASESRLLDISCKELFTDVVNQFGPEQIVRSFVADSVNIALDMSILDLAKYYEKDLGATCPPGAFCKPVPYPIVYQLNKDVGQDGIFQIPREESNRYRYSIGISDINCGLIEYDVFSMFISKPHTVKKLREVSLEVNDYTPLEFGGGNWIKYFISFDNGTSYLRINPVNYNDEKFTDGMIVPKTIYCNLDIPSEFKDRNLSGKHAYYDSAMPIGNVRLKVEFVRPSGNQYKYYTSVLYAYKLKVKSAR